MPSSSAHRKVAGILAIAIVTFLVALVLARQAAARAGPRLESSPDQQSAMPAELAAHVTSIERRLRGSRARLVALANPLIDALRRNEALGAEPLNQEIAVQNARAKHATAELAREIAEIAVVEYEQGIFKKDQAVAVGELKLAESDLERAKEGITNAKERLARIKNVSRGTSTDLANEYLFEDRVVVAELQERKAVYAIELARSKLKVLEEFTKDKTVKELRARVFLARSDELAKKATWELEQGKLKQLKRTASKNDLSIAEKQILIDLDRATVVDDTIRSKLDQLTKIGKPDNELLKNIQDLTNQLELIVEQAESERAAAQLEKLKPSIHGAAKEYLGAGH